MLAGEHPHLLNFLYFLHVFFLEHLISGGGQTPVCVWHGGTLPCTCTLRRHKTRARRFGGHCAEKSEPSHLVGSYKGRTGALRQGKAALGIWLGTISGREWPAVLA